MNKLLMATSAIAKPVALGNRPAYCQGEASQYLVKNKSKATNKTEDDEKN